MASSTVVARGPPPSVSATAKLLRQMAKITISAPGSTAAQHRPFEVAHDVARGLMPRLAASRNRSAGIDCQPCRMIRVASGRLKKTCARTTPCSP